MRSLSQEASRGQALSIQGQISSDIRSGRTV